jgi:HEPN domain-containing protein
MAWLTESEEDLGAARDLVACRRYHLACFHCQQAAEKAAKAVLYARGVEDPWGHSVAGLIEDVASYHPAAAELLAVGAPLDRYYLTTRYPNGLPHGALPSKVYTANDASDAIERAATVIGHMRRLIG